MVVYLEGGPEAGRCLMPHSMMRHIGLDKRCRLPQPVTLLYRDSALS